MNDHLTRLIEQQGNVLCAEGYLFELERRGYLQAGSWAPTVVLEHPEQVQSLHEAFVHAGSDVVQAFTYYAHPERLRMVGAEGKLAEINQQALQIARHVAHQTGTLLAGNLSNTNFYDPDDRATVLEARHVFEQQVQWAVEAGVDYVIGETFSQVTEALHALQAIKEANLQAVITLTFHESDKTREGNSAAGACSLLEASGADVVGINCMRGPATMLPLLRDVLSSVSCPVAALPVGYRTTEVNKSMITLHEVGKSRAFADGLDPFSCTRFDIANFTAMARSMGVEYFGTCCGCGPHHVRAMAETLGRRPPASEYSAAMEKSALVGTDPRVEHSTRAYGKTMVAD